jgi:hypothetical protein
LEDPLLIDQRPRLQADARACVALEQWHCSLPRALLEQWRRVVENDKIDSLALEGCRRGFGEPHASTSEIGLGVPAAWDPNRTAETTPS